MLFTQTGTHSFLLYRACIKRNSIRKYRLLYYGHTDYSIHSRSNFPNASIWLNFEHPLGMRHRNQASKIDKWVRMIQHCSKIAHWPIYYSFQAETLSCTLINIWEMFPLDEQIFASLHHIPWSINYHLSKPHQLITSSETAIDLTACMCYCKHV